MIDVLMTGGTIITMDSDRRIIKNGAVAVKGNKIYKIGTADELVYLKKEAAQVMDCTGKLILPGFIDAHAHAGHSAFKALAADTLSNWMPILTKAYHLNTTDEFWYAEGRLAALERLKSGVTCGLSVMSNAQRSDDAVFSLNNARGYGDVGVRGIVAVGPSNPPYPRVFRRYINGKWAEKQCSFEQLMEGAEASIEAVNHLYNDRIQAVAAPFVLIPSVEPSNPTPPDLAAAPSGQDKLMMKEIRALAKRQGVRIHTEAFGGMIAMAAKCDDALLGPDVHIQHCLGISMQEMLILKETGTNVTSAPNVHQLINRCPVTELISLGVNVAVTTDGTAPSMSFDLLQAARKTQIIQQMGLRDKYLMPAGKLLEMITIDAARAIGREDDLGSLEVEKRADIITVNTHQPHLATCVSPVHQLMMYAVANDVWDVMVDGKILMTDRHVLTVDEDEVMELALKESRSVINRAGLEAFTEPAEGFWGCSRLSFDKNRL